MKEDNPERSLKFDESQTEWLNSDFILHAIDTFVLKVSGKKKDMIALVRKTANYLKRDDSKRMKTKTKKKLRAFALKKKLVIVCKNRDDLYNVDELKDCKEL